MHRWWNVAAVRTSTGVLVAVVAVIVVGRYWRARWRRTWSSSVVVYGAEAVDNVGGSEAVGYSFDPGLLLKTVGSVGSHLVAELDEVEPSDRRRRGLVGVDDVGGIVAVRVVARVVVIEFVSVHPVESVAAVVVTDVAAVVCAAVSCVASVIVAASIAELAVIVFGAAGAIVVIVTAAVMRVAVVSVESVVAAIVTDVVWVVGIVVLSRVNLVAVAVAVTVVTVTSEKTGGFGRVFWLSVKKLAFFHTYYLLLLPTTEAMRPARRSSARVGPGPCVHC